MTKLVDTSNLDFTSIKENLKLFMSQQDEFRDIDFEGSGISILIDLLAHNTHYNAMLAHLNNNESFLVSAKARANVVSHSQALGYVPKSATASKGSVSLIVAGTDITPSGITIPRGYTFSGKINSKTYTYTVLNSISAQKKTNYIANTSYDYYYEFPEVVVHQGVLINKRYRVDRYSKLKAIEIDSNKIDTSTLSVRVYDTSTSTTYTDYLPYDAIEDVKTTSKVFFLRENPYGKYEIFFGDNYIGSTIDPMNVVEVEFIDTDGKEANNIKELATDQAIGGISNIASIVTNGITYGGKDKESTESVRYNASVSYATQNRAVTAADYKNLLMQKFTNIRDVSVWGGEDANPPVYGKVFVAPALNSLQRLSESMKKEMKSWLQYRNVGSVKVEIVDAEYTYIEVECEFKFNPRMSKIGLGEAENNIKDTILIYADDELGRFDGIMRNSNLLTAIDQSDPGVTSSIIRTKIYKSFVPNPLEETQYTLTYPVPLYQSTSAESICESSPFYLGGRLVQIFDEPSDTVFRRNLYVFDILTQQINRSYGDVGYIDTANGNIVIKNIRFDNSNTVEMIARPNTYDITPKYQQLLIILPGDIKVTGTEDTVEKYSVKGLSEYNPASRH